MMIDRIWAVTLTVADLDRAVSFYEGVLGLTKKYQFQDYAGFNCGGVEIGVKTWGELGKPREGEPCIDLLVEDLDESYRELKAHGVVFAKEPRDTLWGGRIADFTDPDGNTLQLTQILWEKYQAVTAQRT
jgi:catechol 2,3-dioxygenase-like lactoylglutathione lyase family enzyme